MEARVNVCSVQTNLQSVEQSTTVHVVPEHEMRTDVSPKQPNNSPATSTTLGVAEIILRVICTVFCIGVLVTAIVTILAINEVEDNFSDNGIEYKHADSYRKAARWLIFVAVMGIFFHSLMIFIRYLYVTSCVKYLFSIYAYLNAALCIVLGLSLFAGGVANAIYAANNAEAIDDISNICDQSNDITADFCNAFKRVRDAETAAASMSFFTMIIFAVLVVIMISSGVIKQQGQDTESSSPTNDDLSSSSSYMSLNAPLYRPRDAPPPYTP